MTLLCASIMVHDLAQALDAIDQAQSAGADLVELRLDEAFGGEGDGAGEKLAIDLVRESSLPVIATCRSREEAGPVGGYDGDDMARVSLYERLGTLDVPQRPPRYLDVEWSTYSRSANLRQKVNLAVAHPKQERDLATSLILSTHDFTDRPSDLARRVRAMQDEDACRVVKLAYRARSVRDTIDLAELIGDCPKPMIAIGMGEYGIPSRILAPRIGGYLTFASIDPEEATAPGQVSLDQLLTTYRFRSIGRSTRVYGVIGSPVAHSLSPLMHNAAFGAIEEDAVLVPMSVAPGYESLKATVLALLDDTLVGFCGAAVTLPHKEELVRLAREQVEAGEAWELDELCELCGAANTIEAERGGDGRVTRVRVRNTDAEAATACLIKALGSALATSHVAVLGAGGVARAVVAGVASRGARVTIFNRSPERAQRIVDEIGGRLAGRVEARGLDACGREVCDAYVNCTPLGMVGGPGPDARAVDLSSIDGLGARTVVFDTVYRPLETPLLAQARSLGMRTVTGLEMFVAQGAAQFAGWTRRDAPVEQMTSSVRMALSE